jgi:hypothetical protein
MLLEVSDSDLVPLGDQCISKLDASKSGIARFYGVDR